MTTTTYRIFQLALSAHLEANQNHLEFAKKYLRGETSIKFWQKEVEETEQAIADAKKLYEKSLSLI